MFSITKSALFAASAASLLACGDNGNKVTPDAHDHDHDAAVTVDAAGPLAVSIPFVARVKGTAFACDQVYAGVGSTAAEYKGQDFRFFVSDVALIPTGGGAPVPVTLTANSNQSADGIALIDFENGTGLCQMGTPSTYSTVVGTVPPGSYNGVTFTMGVPQAKNHLDPAGAAGPLNTTGIASGMSWSWRSGYKFAKIEGQIQVTGTKPVFNLHLGSTGCPGPAADQPASGPCTNPNRPTYTFSNFTLGTSKIVADVANVLADADVKTNMAGTAPGCMSFPGDADCNTVFPKLGLAFEANPAATQTLFKVE